MGKMMPLHRFRQFLSLSALDRWLFVRAFFCLAAVDARLRFFGFQSAVERAKPPPDSAQCELVGNECCQARHYARLIEVVSRFHFVRARCLHRSLVLHYWLRQEGLPSDLRIGVRKDGSVLVAHAWVELTGEVVNDQPGALASFIPLASMSGLPPTWSNNSSARQRGRLAKLNLLGARWD